MAIRFKRIPVSEVTEEHPDIISPPPPDKDNRFAIARSLISQVPPNSAILVPFADLSEPVKDAIIQLASSDPTGQVRVRRVFRRKTGERGLVIWRRGD